MDKAPPMIVARARTDSEASVIKSLLQSYGIPCHYSSEIPHRIYPISGEGLAEVRIYVPGALAEEALAILEAHRRNNAHLHLVEVDPLGPDKP
jgi:hypothetical protein